MELPAVIPDTIFQVINALERDIVFLSYCHTPSQAFGSRQIVYRFQNQDQNSLLVKRQTDNTTPGGMGLDRRGLVPSSHKRS